MRITKKQESILNNLICERLKDNPQSIELISGFESERGALIVDYLKQCGLEEDSEGSTAFYIVRTSDNVVLSFFSLKCGELFDPLFDEEETEDNYEEYLLILQALQNAELDLEARERAIIKLKNMSKQKKMPIRKVLNYILKETKTKHNMLRMLQSDKKTEANDNISRVNKTFPGVELVHFCTNDNARRRWQELGIDRSMGEVIFWKFIAPKFFEVKRIVGCEYAFLFAADLSEDGTLINYYNVSLKFGIDNQVGTNKPLYDFACAFMCQKLNDLEENAKEYFDNFNIDENDEIV